MIDFGSGAVAGLALTAGMLAAFNPCGFALLPAYLTLIVTGSAEEGVTRPTALRRATGFGLAMTLGFAGVFTAFGLLFVLATAGLQGSVLPYLAYVTVAIGIALVALGVRMAAGHEINVPGLRIKGHAPAATFGSQTVYGASFALASMSCTIGPFLAIVSTAINAPGPVAKTTPFLIYAIGMGTSILAISIVAALAGSTVVAGLRRRTPAIMRGAGWLMIVAGIYATLYGLAEILQQHGNSALTGVLDVTGGWQSGITRTIHGWGLPVLITLAVLAVVAVAWVYGSRQRRDREAV
jgi:cytochrome c biogenesis protein CcdA